jgi:hypothetical protein
MDLRAAAKKPKLEKITLDSEYVIKAYGEPLDFYMWDRQPMPTYIHLSTIDQSDTKAMLDAIQSMVLDATGKPMLGPDDQLEPNVMIDMINAVVAQLGNSVGQTLAA